MAEPVNLWMCWVIVKKAPARRTEVQWLPSSKHSTESTKPRFLKLLLLLKPTLALAKCRSSRRALGI